MKIVSKNLFLIFAFTHFCIIYLINEKEAVKQSTRHLLLHFNTVVGSRPFFFDTTYTNPFGEPFTVSKFKYYISHIELKNSVKGIKRFIAGGYYLVNEADSASKSILLSIPQDNYTTISFLLGVDSLKNVSGAQAGALDPGNDMFWTWNTGYVMAKMEGSSPVSKQIHHAIEYHIGGFRGENNVLRKIDLAIPLLPGTNDKKTLNMLIDADINTWFRGEHDLKISENPVCTSPGQLAKQFSENYRNMFTVRSAITEE